MADYAKRRYRKPARMSLVGAAALTTLFMTAIPASAQKALGEVAAECGNPFNNGVGPYDYNNGEDRTNMRKIPIVEKYHFTPVVESLARGSTSESAMGDIDYTLRAVPNHHRALNAMARFDIEKGGIPPRWHSAECWFERAIQFRPDDGEVWLIYANWKARKQRNGEALEAYVRAKKLLPDNIEVDYNMGLLYLKMGQYEKALAHAKTAYAGNYPLQGLRHRLEEKAIRSTAE